MNYYKSKKTQPDIFEMRCDVESTSFVFLHICCTISDTFYGQFTSLVFENKKMDKCHCLAFVSQSVKHHSMQIMLQWQLSFNMFLLSKIPAINRANKLLRHAMNCIPETILRSKKEHDHTCAPQK